MSLVIAIKDQNRIVLGADKQGSFGDSKDHTFTKLWDVPNLEGAIMGGVGTARASQILQYSNIIDRNYINDNEEVTTDYIVTVVVPKIVDALTQNGIVCEDDSKTTMIPNTFIFAYKDKAWMIFSDLSVSEIDDTLAIGSGQDIAKGVLYATQNQNPFQRIVTSIKAAAEHTLFVDDNVDLFATDSAEGDEKLLAELSLGDDIDAIDVPEVEEKKETKKEKKKAKKEEKKKEKQIINE